MDNAKHERTDHTAPELDELLTEPPTDTSTEALTASLHQMMPMAAHLGIRLTTWTDEQVTMELDWSRHLTNPAGSLHGGAIMSLADCAGAAIAQMKLPAHAVGTTTIESKTNMFGAVRSGSVRATARAIHIGSTTIVVDVELHRLSDERLVGKTLQTQAVLVDR